MEESVFPGQHHKYCPGKPDSSRDKPALGMTMEDEATTNIDGSYERSTFRLFLCAPLLLRGSFSTTI
jgi:hypothetical protein